MKRTVPGNLQSQLSPFLVNCSQSFGARPENRRGSLMVEMVVCTVLLSVISAILVPAVFAVQQQRKATQFETLTLVELNNLAVQVPLTKTSELTLSSWFTKRYPDAQLSIEEPATKTENDLGLRPIQLTIIRPHREGIPDTRRTLTVWRKSAEGES